MMFPDRRGQRSVAIIVGALSLLTIALTPGGVGAESHDGAWSPPALSGEAGELLDGRTVVQRVVDFMQSHRRLAFEAVATQEVLQESGQKLHFTMLHRVTMQRPERIFWVTLYDNASKETAWCDNGSFTLLREPANIWGRVEVPPSTSAAIPMLSEDYNVVVPFVDVLSGDVGELWLGETVERIDYIGESWMDGHWTDHVALRKPGVDVQLWFRQGDEPFPVKIAIVRTDEDGQPGFWATFRQWSTQVPDGAVPQFAPPEGSERIEIAPASNP